LYLQEDCGDLSDFLDAYACVFQKGLAKGGKIGYNENNLNMGGSNHEGTKAL
jgi:hypothetical protein